MNLDSLLGQPHATFHDAVIERIEVDYLRKVAVIHLQIDEWNPDASSLEDRERKIPGTLTVSGLLYFVMEPPDENYPFQANDGLWISEDEITPRTPGVSARLPWNLPEEAFVHRLFVNEWNSFIYLAGTHAEFVWK
ncbi:hypothetical protein [Geothrix sp. 21YS21S-2]|uniref:hypothetical protein n=1 Tax=Geothrix sp. 21YS21S-2 TaxID=3068893 RepID=UPI0027B89349|nr:hypothetical protein [Geothrix sp. 21YS21S-2]